MRNIESEEVSESMLLHTWNERMLMRRKFERKLDRSAAKAKTDALTKSFDVFLNKTLFKFVAEGEQSRRLIIWYCNNLLYISPHLLCNTHS